MSFVVAVAEVTPSKLRTASNHLRRYKQRLAALREDDDEIFKKLEERLVGLWADLGYARDKDGSGESELYACAANWWGA